MKSYWQRKELPFLILYAIAFYAIIIHRALQLSRVHYTQLHGMQHSWIIHGLNDASDAQWRHFRGNLPILTLVFAIFTVVATVCRTYGLKAKGMSIIWLLISLAYLSYLHGTCLLYVFSIASGNYLIVKICGRTKFVFVLWIYNLAFLVCNRVYDGYPFSSFGQRWAYLDNYRGTFRWHICFNFVVLRMLSFGYDYHWADKSKHFDEEKHLHHCEKCSSGRTCYLLLQERTLQDDKFSIATYLCYLFYAPLYIAGPIISFNAFASQWDVEIFITNGCLHHRVLNFMWLKFFLIWRYFRLWSLVYGIEPPENMPRCINNCYNLQTFWKNWHASFNKWLVRYMYIPLGGSGRKLLNVWVIFTFVAIWHDLEWKLLSWAWLTCLFFIPEMVVKSTAYAFKAESAFGELFYYELNAVAGAVTITCLMIANLVGFVIGPSGINWLSAVFLTKKGLPVLCAMLVTFYIGTKLMLHISDSKKRKLQK